MACPDVSQAMSGRPVMWAHAGSKWRASGR